ncbi:MAG TPA: hypothetical protein VE690_05720 [Rhodopila sp.]|nr:hypothetical protein [Rhodopila sp.]
MSSSQGAQLPLSVTRGVSRFRIRVVYIAGSAARPYGWEIYDDEDGRIVRRSADKFRTSAEAWAAGSSAMDHSV